MIVDLWRGPAVVSCKDYEQAYGEYLERCVWQPGWFTNYVNTGLERLSLVKRAKPGCADSGGIKYNIGNKVERAFNAHDAQNCNRYFDLFHATGVRYRLWTPTLSNTATTEFVSSLVFQRTRLCGQ